MHSPRNSARSVSNGLPWSARRPLSVASATVSVGKDVLLLTLYDDTFFSSRRDHRGLDAHRLPPTSLTCADPNVGLGGIDVHVGIDSKVDFLVKDRKVVCRETLQRVVNECEFRAITSSKTTGDMA